MQKKFTLLACAVTALISFNNAFAQSSHDAKSKAQHHAADKTHHHDIAHEDSHKFAIHSADGNYSMRLGGYLQENNQFTKTGEDKKINLELKRAHLMLSGHALSPSISYFFQIGSRNAEKRVQPIELNDAYLNVDVSDRYFQVKAGKFSPSGSRQSLMSAAHGHFFDPAFYARDFSIGKDIGIMLHNGGMHPFEWSLSAVTQGISARIAFNHGDIDEYDMVDWTHGQLRYGIGAHGFWGTDYMSANLKDVRAGADLIIKVAGFATNAAFYYQMNKPEEANAEAANRFGADADLGYLIKGHYEPVVRYVWTKEGGSENNDHQVLGGLNYYAYGHHLKVQAYGGADLRNKEVNNWKAGVQVQLAI